MNGQEFIRRVQKLGRRQGVPVEFDQARGKGSHGTLTYGGNRTIVKRSEIGTGLLMAMLKQLGISKEDFNR